MSPRASLEVVEKKQPLAPTRNRTQTVHLVACRRINRPILAPSALRKLCDKRAAAFAQVLEAPASPAISPTTMYIRLPKQRTAGVY